MTRTIIAAAAVVAVAVGGVATAAVAADIPIVNDYPLIIETPPPPPSHAGLYVLMFGGASLSGPADFYDINNLTVGSAALDAGWAAGGAIGVHTPIEGVSVELDLLHSTRTASNVAGAALATTTLMVNAKYTLQVNEVFDIYAGVGVGGAAVNASGAGSFSGTGLGVQAMLGASANVAYNIALFGEARFQNVAAAVDIGPDVVAHIPSVSLLGGVKFSF